MPAKVIFLPIERRPEQGWMQHHNETWLLPVTVRKKHAWQMGYFPAARVQMILSGEGLGNGFFHLKWIRDGALSDDVLLEAGRVHHALIGGVEGGQIWIGEQRTRLLPPAEAQMSFMVASGEHRQRSDERLILTRRGETWDIIRSLQPLKFKRRYLIPSLFRLLMASNPRGLYGRAYLIAERLHWLSDRAAQKEDVARQKAFNRMDAGLDYADHFQLAKGVPIWVRKQYDRTLAADVVNLLDEIREAGITIPEDYPPPVVFTSSDLDALAVQLKVLGGKWRRQHLSQQARKEHDDRA